MLATGLFQQDQIVSLEPQPGPVPPPQGISTHTFRVWNGARTVTVSTGNLSKSQESFYKPSPTRERLAQLATRLLAPERWLDAAAWMTSTSRPYVASGFRLFLSDQPVAGSLPDVDAIDWPFARPLANFGDQLPSLIVVPMGPGAIRCVALIADDARVVRNALERGGAPISDFFDGGYTSALTSRASGSGIALLQQRLLPDQSSCADDY